MMLLSQIVLTTDAADASHASLPRLLMDRGRSRTVDKGDGWERVNVSSLYYTRNCQFFVSPA